MASGALRCWGANAAGQLGDGTTVDRYAPVEIATSGWLLLSVGTFHVAGVRTP
jgi:hypothetical protein